MRDARAALTLVIAMALGAPSPAQAQLLFFTSSGDNLSFPTNLFPINPASPVLNFTGNVVSIGNSGVGTFVANNGGVLLADKLTIANSGTGVGGVTVTGAGTQVLLSGVSPTNNGNRLEVGNWGIGSLSVTGGAVVDAAQNAAGCSAPGVFCNSFIGNGAGSSGVLNISGAGSTVSTIGFTGIGSTAVFTQANDGFNFGTPGGTTNGAVNITAGGRFNTQQATVGNGPNTAAALGTELGIGSVVIDGTGSQWLATRNTINNSNASVGIGGNVGGQGTVIVRNGGRLTVDGTGGSTSNFDGVTVGFNGGHGTLTVTGIGSNVTTIGANPFINVGRSGASGQGTLNVLNGATASSLFMNVGRDGATGTVTIDGAGSQMSLLGVSTPGLAGGGTAFAIVGRGGGTGDLTVSNGGRLFISDNGGNSRAAPGSPGFIVGWDAGSTGTMTITGPGSVVEVTSTSRSVPAGAADNFNPFVSVGEGNVAGGAAHLQISNGGKLVLTGNGVSNPTFGSSTQLNIGGRSGVTGTGSATVTGAGSEIALSGFDTYIGVGRSAGSSGTLNVLDNAKVSATSLLIGAEATGHVVVDNAHIALSGFRTDSSNVGAGTTVGRGAGSNATLTLSNGARLTIENNTLAGGMSIGGDQFLSGGSGSVSLTGGSSITMTGSIVDGGLTVGRTGGGTISVSGGSTVDVGNTRSILVGRNVGGVGALTIVGGSLVTANSITIGGESDTTSGGTGAASVSGVGSVLRASGPNGFIGVGRLGTGDLTVTNGGAVESTILHVGRGVGANGSLTVDNARIDLSGQQTTGSLSGARLGIGVGGGTGVADIRNGSVVTLTNLGSDGAVALIGGTGNNPLGTGTLNVSNSQIIITAASGLGGFSVGRDGTGTANLTQGSTVVLGDGLATVGRFAGGQGTLNVNGGSSLEAGRIAIGGAGDGVPGGVGSVTVSGLGSELRAGGPVGTINVGQGGSGSLNVTSQAQITGTVLNVGLGAGSTGALSLNNGTLALSGQTAAGQGASLNIGTGGGVGTVSITNGSTVTITNLGIGGASINVGGSPAAPLGVGTLNVANSTINVIAAPGLAIANPTLATVSPGLATVRIGHDGIGSATFTTSLLNIGDGSLIIAGQPGSVGSLILSAGSVVNVGYVGVGSTLAGPGGVATLVMNDSTINTNVFQIGALGILSGNNAVINSTGDVVVAGTISPGNSPGRININCNLISLPGSALILDILGTGTGFDVDHLIIGNESTFNLSNFQVVFNFLGDTDPNAFAASGGFDLDNFLRTGVGSQDFGLSTAFAAGQTWDTVINSSLITVVSSAFNFSGLSLSADGGVTITASRLPEPATWLIVLFGLLALTAAARGRRGAASVH